MHVLLAFNYFQTICAKFVISILILLMTSLYNANLSIYIVNMYVYCMEKFERVNVGLMAWIKYAPLLTNNAYRDL